MSRLGRFIIDENEPRVAQLLSYRTALAETAGFEEEIKAHQEKAIYHFPFVICRINLEVQHAVISIPSIVYGLFFDA